MAHPAGASSPRPHPNVVDPGRSAPRAACRTRTRPYVVAPRSACDRPTPGFPRRSHPGARGRCRHVRVAHLHLVAVVRPPAARLHLLPRPRVDRGPVAGGRPRRPHRLDPDRPRVDLRQPSPRAGRPAGGRRRRRRTHRDPARSRPRARRVRPHGAGRRGAERSDRSSPPSTTHPPRRAPRKRR